MDKDGKPLLSGASQIRQSGYNLVQGSFLGLDEERTMGFQTGRIGKRMIQMTGDALNPDLTFKAPEFTVLPVRFDQPLVIRDTGSNPHDQTANHGDDRTSATRRSYRYKNYYEDDRVEVDQVMRPSTIGEQTIGLIGVSEGTLVEVPVEDITNGTAVNTTTGFWKDLKSYYAGFEPQTD
jgi:hypothetical protein